MVFGRRGRPKKIEEADKLPQADDEVEEDVDEQEEQEEEENYDEKIAYLNKKIEELRDMSLNKAVKKVRQEEEEQEEEVDVPPKKPKAKGSFTLESEEMALAVNALASSEEFKLYQKVLVGQRIMGVIQNYQKYAQEQQGNLD